MADVYCELSNFTIDSYDERFTNIQGSISRYNSRPNSNPEFVKDAHLAISNYSESGATKRRTAIAFMALTAKQSNKNLELYFLNIDDCASYSKDVRLSSIKIK